MNESTAGQMGWEAASRPRRQRKLWNHQLSGPVPAPGPGASPLFPCPLVTESFKVPKVLYTMQCKFSPDVVLKSK